MLLEIWRGWWSYPGITVVLRASDCARVLLVLDESWRMTQGVHLQEEKKASGTLPIAGGGCFVGYVSVIAWIWVFDGRPNFRYPKSSGSFSPSYSSEYFSPLGRGVHYLLGGEGGCDVVSF